VSPRLIHRVSRQQPHGPAIGYRTFAYHRPLATHWRRASCEEVECDAYLHGWYTTVDERTDLGAGQAYYIRRSSGRSFHEHRTEQGRTLFAFGPGQMCFRASDHRLPIIERPALWIVRDGDWRGNPTGWSRTHARGEHWVEEWAEHQARLRAQL
jgi:hypothetical protein